MKVNPFEDTPEEKNQKILDMLEEGYPYKTIMTTLNVSPSSISKAKKKKLGYTEDESLNQIVQPSKESQAFRMFQQGASIVNTKIELDITSSEAAEYHKRFLELQSCDHFITAYNNVRGNIYPFLDLLNLMIRLGMTPAQVGNAVKYGNELPQLQNNHSTLSEEVRALESQKLTLSTQVNLMEPQWQNDMKNLEYYKNECGLKRNEISALNSEINTKKTFIQNFDNDEGYIRIKNAAAQQVNSVIQDNRVILDVTVSATLEAVRRYHYNQELFIELIKSQEPYQQSRMRLHGSQLLLLTENVLNEMTEKITKKTMNTVQDTQSESKKEL